MNALKVEQAWKTAAAAIYAPLPGFCGTSDEIISGEDVVVVFICDECEHKAGPYWLALLRIEVDAPVLAAGNLAPYSATWTALLQWLNDPEAVNAAFSGSGISLNGYFVRGSGQGERDKRWIAGITLVAGVSEA